jgi:hypothetical protein
MMRTWKRWLVAGIGGLLALVLVCLGVAGPCWSTWARDGVLVYQCPAGVMPRVRVSGYGLGRGVQGTVSVNVVGEVYGRQLAAIQEAPLRRFSVELAVVAADGTETALDPVSDFWSPDWGWVDAGTQSAVVVLPEALPDGDYILRARVDTPRGEVVADAPLPLYRPALEHLLTDAPLYRPGQVVRARAVVLEAGTLGPAGERPGRWQLYDPSGELVFEEKGRTSAMGMTETTFPLASDAEVGTWTVGFLSGDLSTRRSFEVKPFRLPRFTVNVSGTRAWWGKGDAPRLDGRAVYTSGAPVANAPVRVTVSASGAWPPPNDWLGERSATTDSAGRFTLDFPRVPDDLVGTATLRVSAGVTEEAGETAWGGSSLLLSEDALGAEAVTEFGAGLVADTNNRVYLRVTRPDGSALADTRIKVRRDWDSRDPGVDAQTDADGVARVQLDPGQPITVVEPSLPIRPPPPVPAVQLSRAWMGGDAEPADDLVDAALQDSLVTAWAPCAALGDRSGTVQLRADRAGVTHLWAPDLPAPVRGCLLRQGARAALRGDARFVSYRVALHDPGGPRLSANTQSIEGQHADVPDLLAAAVSEARGCASASVDGAVPAGWVWEVSAGERAVRLTPVEARGERALAGVAACLRSRLSSPLLEAPADAAASGLLTVFSTTGREAAAGRTSPASWPGFSLLVSAEGIGQTTLRMPVGEVPPLRLRLSEVVVDPGAEVQITAIRGAVYRGTLPEKLNLSQGDRVLTRIDLDPKNRTGTFVVPADAAGFASVDWEGAQAVLYIRPPTDLQLDLAATGDWAPGQEATLALTTRDRRGPVSAAVSLVGVDATMSTLAPLPGADDWADTTVLATSDSPAFGVLDARALQTGGVRGENAAQAAVLRVSQLPPVQPGADHVAVSAIVEPDVESPLAASFYPLYGEARKAVRAWEKTAGEADVMTAARMAALWEDTLAKHPATDPFGRSLHLSILPADLLALTDPRVMVADARHLPEDVENWNLYVIEEAR